MDKQQPPTGISAADWQTTPEAVRELVVGLLTTL
jgi:hypothetical protein